MYSFDKKLDTIFLNLKYDLENVLSWFQANSLKANPSKFRLTSDGFQTAIFGFCF